MFSQQKTVGFVKPKDTVTSPTIDWGSTNKHLDSSNKLRDLAREQMLKAER